MKTTDPFLRSAEIDWIDSINIQEATESMVGSLSKLAELLESCDEEDGVDAAEQAREEMYMLRHFLTRLKTVVGGGSYAREGICQIFYRLSALQEDFDRFVDREVNEAIREVAVLGAKSLRKT